MAAVWLALAPNQSVILARRRPGGQSHRQPEAGVLNTAERG
jgi:hypothetical protein